MRKLAIATVIAMILCVGTLVWAQSFTDVNSAKYHGKTGLKKLTSVVDANFALVESGSDVTRGTVTCTQLVVTAGGGSITGAVDIVGALTATSYGGVTEANVLDKTATETVSGIYSLTNSGNVINAGAYSANGTPGIDFSLADTIITNMSMTISNGIITAISINP